MDDPPPRDAVDADACAAIVDAMRRLMLCDDPATPEQEAHNRARLADGVAAAGRLVGSNRAEWRRLCLGHLVRAFVSMTLPDEPASYVELGRLRRELGLTDSP